MVSFILDDRVMLIFLIILINIFHFDAIKKYIFLAPVLIILLFVFFHNENFDYEYYKYYFQQVLLFDSFRDKLNYDGSLVSFEIGFVFLSTILSYLTSNSDVFILLVFIISFFMINYCFCQKKENYIWYLSMYLGWFFIPYGQVLIRQGVAISLFIFLTQLALEKKSKFLLPTALSSFFHLSSLVTLCSFFSSFLNSKRRISTLVLFSFFIGYYYGVVDLIIQFSRIVDNQKLSSYLVSEYSGSFNLDSLKNVRLLIISTFIIYFWENIDDKRTMYFAQLYIIGVSLCFILSDVYILSTRLPDIYLVFSIFVIPDLLSNILDKIKTSLVISLYSVLLIVL